MRKRVVHMNKRVGLKKRVPLYQNFSRGDASRKDGKGREACAFDFGGKGGHDRKKGSVTSVEIMRIRRGGINRTLLLKAKPNFREKTRQGRTKKRSK